MRDQKKPLYIGLRYYVVALDPDTGQEFWRTKLRQATITTVWLSDGALFAGCNGELFWLDPATGAVLWHNRLKGLGYGVITFPGTTEAAASRTASAPPTSSVAH